MTRFNFVTMQMLEDDAPTDDDIQGNAFMEMAMNFDLNHWVAEAAAEVGWEPRYTEIWNEVEAENGAYRFDIGVPLPYFLPNLAGKCEYALTVGTRKWIFSNRMAQCFLGPGSGDGALGSYYLVRRVAVPGLMKSLGQAGHVLPLKGFACARFEASAPTATEAIRANFATWRDEIAEAVDRVVETMRVHAKDTPTPLLPVPTITSFSVMWVVVHGAKGQRGFRQFSGGMGAAALRSLANIDAADVPRLQATLNGSLQHTHAEVALGLARAYSKAHHFNLALVQVCVACEVALLRAYRSFLQSRGLSRSKFDDVRHEVLTLSSLLGVHLYSMRDIREFADASKHLGRLKWARERRNDIAHGRTPRDISRHDVDAAIEAASTLIQFLDQPPTTEDSPLASE